MVIHFKMFYTNKQIIGNPAICLTPCPPASTIMPLIEAQKFKDSDILLIGEDPLTLDEQGKIKNGVHTFIVSYKVYINIPGIHSMQRELFIDYLNQERERIGQPKLKSCEADVIKNDGAAIVIDYDEEDGTPVIWIRNDGNEARAKRAREILCEVYPEEMVRIC